MFARLPTRHLVALLALALVAIWVGVRQRAILQAGQEQVDRQRQLARLQDEIASRDSALAAERLRVKELEGNRSRLCATIAGARQQLATVDPEAAWATPPEGGPTWDERSPYVWLRKDRIAELPVQPFTDDAEIPAALATVLCLDPATHQALNAQLRDLMERHRQLETAHAERVDTPLPGMPSEGPQVTLQVNPSPEDAMRLRKQFEAILTAALGDQRSGLLIQAAEGWFDSQFGGVDAEAKTISVARHPDGTYSVSVRTGNSWLSTSGFVDLDRFVPKHLLPFFSDVIPPGASVVQPAAP